MALSDDLNNLQAAPNLDVPKNWRPAVEFDGTQGEATTQGFLPDEKPDFDKFLVEAGFDPKEIEIVGEPRTSRWQVARPFPLDPQWLTAYRFRFKKRVANIDLPLLYAEAKKTKRPKEQPAKPAELATLIQWSDLQVGKVDHRGGSKELLLRVADIMAATERFIKKHKPDIIMFNDLGDSIEGFESGGNPGRTNDLSLMQQVDLEATLRWDMLKMLAKYAPVKATSIGSNHCQWRAGKVRLGTAHDDWGLHIQRSVARLAKEVGLPIQFFEPAPFQESLVIDVFGDGYHRPGFMHGHQAGSADKVVAWWRGQAHGSQPVAAATMLFHGHWHHTRVFETGRVDNRSRWVVGCPTLDGGSSWHRQTAGEDSDPGLLVLNLEKQRPFTGTVYKL